MSVGLKKQKNKTKTNQNPSQKKKKKPTPRTEQVMKYKAVLENYLGFLTSLITLHYDFRAKVKEFLKQDLSWHGSTVMQDIQNSQMHQLFAHIPKKLKHIANAQKSLNCSARKLALGPR